MSWHLLGHTEPGHYLWPACQWGRYDPTKPMLAVGHHHDLGELVLELVEVMDDEPFRKR